MGEFEKQISTFSNIIYQTWARAILKEAKKEFPKCKDCKYGERNKITPTGCTLDIGLRNSFCPKNIWFKKWFK